MKAGEQLRLGEYTQDVPWRPKPFSGMADVERVLAEWERGATIVLQGLHLTQAEVAAFCRSLEAALEHPVQANAYYTPRGSQGLPVHHDTHDVISLQVAGEKRWLVYEPALELPLRDQRYKPELGERGAPVHDLVLRPGDTLYLPRGWLHEALTSETDSLHLTVGVNVVTWLDAFRAALDECADDVGFRRSVDGGGADELVEALRARLNTEDVARRARRKLVRTRRPIRERQFDQLRALQQLDPETELERRPTVLADLVERDGEVTLVFEGRDVSFPAYAAEEVRGLLELPEPFTAAELPGSLDDDSRLVLVRRLVREGLLRISEA